MKCDLKFKLEQEIFIVDFEEDEYKIEIFTIKKWYYVIDSDGIFIYIEDWGTSILVDNCFGTIDEAIIKVKEIYNNKIKDK